MIVLGISGFESSGSSNDRHPYLTGPAPDVPLRHFPLHLIGHDAAAALVIDGELVASASEERFTRVKHGFNLAGRTVLPRRAMAYCLREAGLSYPQVDCFAHYCRFTPETVASRLDRVAARLLPAERSVLRAEYEEAYSRRLAGEVVRAQLEAITGGSIPPERFLPVPHHLAHAAGAFYSSGFEEAVCLTLDGYGEEQSSIWTVADRSGIHPEGSIPLPTSLGVLYQIISAFLGFRTFGDEYKVMGLSAYGTPRTFRSVFEELVELTPEGGYSTASLCRPDLDEWLVARLGCVGAGAGSDRRSADIAAALQRRLEEAVLHTAAHLCERYGIARLCISGGVGLNACANGAIVRSGLFEKVFVQPAPSDDGACLGAAFHAQRELSDAGTVAPVRHVYWGPSYDNAEIEAALERSGGLRWERPANVLERAARLLAEEKVIGWFQGRMEIGPRALGARSILASPGSERLRDRINSLVKGRERFRPFAPSVTREAARAYFDIPDETASPFMVATYPVRESMRGRIAGVVHVDGSARVQTVSEDENPRYHGLLGCVEALTGVPVLLNTSFNRAGEPIVASPADAVGCFLESGLDALVIGDHVAFPSPPAAPGGATCA